MAAHARLKNEFTEDEKYHNAQILNFTCKQLGGSSGVVHFLYDFVVAGHKAFLLTLWSLCCVGVLRPFDTFQVISGAVS